MRQSDADLVATLAHFPLERAPTPSPHSISGKMLRGTVLKAMWQQFEAGRRAHESLDHLIVMGRTGDTSRPPPAGVARKGREKR